MAAATDVLLILRQARDGRMARTKLIDVIVAREGVANRDATTAAVEKALLVQIKNGRITSELKGGVEYLIAQR